MLDQAISFAALAHAGQKRKNSDLPYITHPIEVMSLVIQHANEPTEEMLVAAVLHDVVEDTNVGLNSIRRRFGDVVAQYVDDLTDKFPAGVGGNRKERKTKEHQRLAETCDAVQTVKFADLISNTRTIVRDNRSFAPQYLAEKLQLLSLMKGGDKNLRELAWHVRNTAAASLTL